MPIVKVFCVPPANTCYNETIGKGITNVLSELQLCESDSIRIFFIKMDAEHFSRGGMLLKEYATVITPETSSYYVEVNLASGASLNQEKAICSKVTAIIAGCGISVKNIGVTVLEYPAGVYMVGGKPV